MINGKVAIVTGGSRGIGKAIAGKFLDNGASVAICGMEEEEVEQTVVELGKKGSVYGQLADVSDEASVAAFVENVLQRFGSIDVLANNAGIAPQSDFLNLPVELWDKTMNVNLKGAFLVAQTVSRTMVAQGGGVIVNMSSTNGLFGEKGLAAYNASKAGMILLTKTMALELAPYGIRVNAVCPGFIGTELALNSGFDEAYLNECIAKVPLQRWGQPEEVADLFLFLSSSMSSYITGQYFIIDGGQTTAQ